MNDARSIIEIAESLRMIDESQARRAQAWTELSGGLQSIVDRVEENQRRENAMRDKEISL